MRLISTIHVSVALLLTVVYAAPMPVEIRVVNTEAVSVSAIETTTPDGDSSIGDAFSVLNLPTSTQTADDDSSTGASVSNEQTEVDKPEHQFQCIIS
ncbi:hypothetical protein C8R47DRAFT_1317662 [Mycena vitilis]|nr:hypothetical protein C8R47DRAFT_1317662 [Mycena vitilis]